MRKNMETKTGYLRKYEGGCYIDLEKGGRAIIELLCDAPLNRLIVLSCRKNIDGSFKGIDWTPVENHD